MTTRYELHAEIIELLGTLPTNEPITNERVLEVVSKHPQWTKKTCGGLYHLRKDAGSGLWLYDPDGKEVGPISFNTAISAYLGLKKKRTDWRARAMRMAIQPQVVSFRLELGILGKGGIEIDHCNEGGFHGLCQEWMKVEGISPADIRIRKLKSGFFVMGDRALRGRWARYHRENARLHAVPVEEHRKLTSERKKGLVVELQV